MAGPCQGKGDGMGGFFFSKEKFKIQKSDRNKQLRGEAEAVKEKRDEVGHPTAERPGSFVY